MRRASEMAIFSAPPYAEKLREPSCCFIHLSRATVLMTELPSSSTVTERTFARRTAATENGLRIRIEQASIRIIKTCDFYTKDLLTDKALDDNDFLYILTDHDGKRIAHALGPSRTTDTMNIVFR